MRRLSVALPAALAVRFQTAAPAASTTNSKQQVLHKILTGEVQFKNKALVKDSNVELQFGANWKKPAFTATAHLLATAVAVVVARTAQPPAGRRIEKRERSSSSAMYQLKRVPVAFTTP